MMNRLANCHNRWQGAFPRILCVCSAGLLRSPTLAWVLSQEPYNCNTRAAGVNPDFALIPIDRVHMEWADMILCVSTEVMQELIVRHGKEYIDKMAALKIPDNFSYRDPELITIIKTQYDALIATIKENDDETVRTI